jgi:hypothetical protein
MDPRFLKHERGEEKMDNYIKTELEFTTEKCQFLVQRLFSPKEAGSLILASAVSLKAMKRQSSEDMKDQIKKLSSGIAKLIEGLPDEYRPIIIESLDHIGITISTDLNVISQAMVDNLLKSKGSNGSL